ncbi:MAG: DUF3429 domain-containing protein [Gammaproteobacteria bacterium]|jgi:hypothetical protein
MDSDKSKTYPLLAYAGAIPFVLCAIAPWLGVTDLGRIGSVGSVAASYGLAIVSFMAGILWGICLIGAKPVPGNLFFVSNAVTLAAWFAFLLTPPTVALGVMALLFLYLLMVDARLTRTGALDDRYFRTRRNVTLLVVLSLVLTQIAA